jgi:hypothetical protein
MSATSWLAIVERRWLATRSERPWKPKVYAPSLIGGALRAGVGGGGGGRR